MTPTLQAPKGSWLKGDFHVHSSMSHDATTMGDDIAGLVKCAEYAGLDFTTISDHRHVDCLKDPQFLGSQSPVVLLAGEEWGGPGHAGAHGLVRDPVFHTHDEGQGPITAIAKVQQAIDDVNGMGGFFSLNHPMDEKCPWLWPVERFSGIEVWNTMWAIRNSWEMDAAQLAKWSVDHKVGLPGMPALPPESVKAVAARGGGANWQRLRLYEEHLNSGRKIAALGGSDTHYLFLPGNPTTMVFTDKRSKDGIVEAVKKGRTMVKRSPSAPCDLELTADRDGDGLYESILGDSIPLGKPIKFRVLLKNVSDGKVELLRNGQVVQTWAVSNPKFEVTWSDTPTT
ncbi:MAG TPA: CehA/McbA family metallohydrolase, partial [Acidimicrobiales bacterium]|nr:CehA/McbA family metallohydrolase [Acidimicrobiales bacterium]